MPAADRRRPTTPRRLRCETCLEVLSLRHAWDVRGCGCGALLLSGRPARPTVHWLSRPGGGWTELEDDPDGDSADRSAQTDDDQGKEEDSERPPLGFSARRLSASAW